jgi:hypothetical protein
MPPGMPGGSLDPHNQAPDAGMMVGRTSGRERQRDMPGVGQLTARTDEPANLGRMASTGLGLRPRWAGAG